MSRPQQKQPIQNTLFSFFKILIYIRKFEKMTDKSRLPTFFKEHQTYNGLSFQNYGKVLLLSSLKFAVQRILFFNFNNCPGGEIGRRTILRGWRATVLVRIQSWAQINSEFWVMNSKLKNILIQNLEFRTQNFSSPCGEIGKRCGLRSRWSYILESSSLSVGTL